MESKGKLTNARLQALVDDLSGESRRARQIAAKELALYAKDNLEMLLPYGLDFVDALNRPEAQTRWECLGVLVALVELDQELCESAIPGAETALFDEESGLVRLGAMRLLCKLGSASPEVSERVWPLIDEGIQCCHGDPEFQDMLDYVVDFSLGNISDTVRQSLGARMKFDAQNARGPLKRRAQQILDNTTKG